MIIVSDLETYMREVLAVETICGPILYTLEKDFTREGVHEDNVHKMTPAQARRLAKKIYAGALAPA